MDPQQSRATVLNKSRPIRLHDGKVQRSNCKGQGTICIAGYGPPGILASAHDSVPFRPVCARARTEFQYMHFHYTYEFVLQRGLLMWWDFAKMSQVFFIQDLQHPGWRVVLQKEPRSRRVVDNEDEQILGISGELIGLQVPVNMNAMEFRRNPGQPGERVPAAEVERLNALVRGERYEEHEHGRARRRRGRGRGRGRGGIRRRAAQPNMN